MLCVFYEAIQGHQTSEIQLYSHSLQTKVWNLWLPILHKRAKGEFSYPAELDTEIRALEKLGRLAYQHFTDDKETALGYVRRENGMILEIDVPLKDLKKYFSMEFQNFSKRKKRFKVVYLVRGSDLYRRAKTWRLKTSS